MLVGYDLTVYRTRWELRSSVRTRPTKSIDFNVSGYFFPPERQTLLLLPEVFNLGEEVKRELLLQTFCKYLNDIIHLEVKWINSCCNTIAQKQLGILYSEDAKIDSYTIIMDEYYHVYTANYMLMQIRNHYPKFVPIVHNESDSNHAMIKIRQRLPQKYHDIFEIIAVCIFETTLVRELINYFDSDEVHPSVKYYINDHINDESRHYHFFFEILCETWKQLTQEDKAIIGKQLPEFIYLYLNIDAEKHFNLLLLINLNFSVKHAQQLVDTLYSGFVISHEIPMVKQVLAILNKAGVMDDVYVKQQFKKKKLIILD